MRRGAVLLFWIVSIWGAHASPCLDHLKLGQVELDATYTRVLNRDFNKLYGSRASSAGKKLRAIFSFLDLDLPLGGDAVAVLQSTLAHLHNDPSFVDRYYAGSLSARLGAVRETWQILDARLDLLNDFVKGKQPAKPELIETLLDTLVGDFVAANGFSSLPIEQVRSHLEITREEYENSLNRAEDDYVPWTDDSSEGGSDPSDNFWRGDITSSDGDENILVFPGEDREQSLELMRSLRPEHFKNATTKAAFDNFGDISEIPNFHFYVTHRADGNRLILINVYERGLNFLLGQAKAPTTDEDPKYQTISAQNFFYNVSILLTGKLEARFQNNFTFDARQRLTPQLTALRARLTANAPASGIYTDADVIGRLNVCLEAVDLPPLNFGP